MLVFYKRVVGSEWILVYDDLINIFLTISEQAKTLASEGGYGINFDFIRPRGSIIGGIGAELAGEATGQFLISKAIRGVGGGVKFLKMGF